MVIAPVSASTCAQQRCGTCPRQCQRVEVSHVDPDQRAAIAAAAERIVPQDASLTESAKVSVAESLSRQIAQIAPELATSLSRVLQPGGPPSVAVRGLPVLDESQTEILSLAVGTPLGQPFQFVTQNHGKLAARLEPKDGSKPNSNSSRKEFGHHSDDAALLGAYRTELITLYGFANKCGAPTGYTPVRVVLPKLGDFEEVLSQPRFRFRFPVSFGLGVETWSDARPVLWRDGNDEPCISFPSYATRAFDSEDAVAVEAIVKLAQLLEANTTYFVVGPGDFLVFSNDRGTHNRKPIEGERLVFRSYRRRSLAALRQATGADGYVFDLTQLI